MHEWVVNRTEQNAFLRYFLAEDGVLVVKKK